MSKSASLTEQSIWILIAKTVGVGLNTALPLLTVRYLTHDDYGTYRQSFLFATNLIQILPIGVSMSAFYFLNGLPEKRSAAVANILLFNLVVGGLFFLTTLIAPQGVGLLFQNPRLTQLAPIVGILVWFTLISALLEIIPLANQDTRTGSAFILLSQTMRAAMLLLAVFLFGTVESLLLAAIIQAALQGIVLLFYLNTRFPSFWREFHSTFLAEQLRYAIPFGIAGLIYVAQTDVHFYFVSHYYSPAEFAIYSVGCFQIPMIWAVYESVTAIVIPRMSQFRSTGRFREMLLLSASAMQKLAFVFFPIFFFLEVIADEFIRILFTEAYMASTPIFRVNLILLPFFCILVDPVGRAFPEMGRFLLKIRVLILALLLGTLSLLVTRIELNEVISVVVAILLLELAISVWRVGSVLRVKFSDRSIFSGLWRTLFAASTAGVAFWILYSYVKIPAELFFDRIGRNITEFLGISYGGELIGGLALIASSALVFATLYLMLSIYTRSITAWNFDGLTDRLRSLRGKDY